MLCIMPMYAMTRCSRTSTYVILIREFLRLSWPLLFVPAINMIRFTFTNFFYWKIVTSWTWTNAEIKKIQASSQCFPPMLTMLISSFSSPMLIQSTAIHLLIEACFLTTHDISKSSVHLILKHVLRLSLCSNFFVWARAASNHHYFVALASLMTILTFSFQPLASSLLIVRDTWWQLPGVFNYMRC